jgi:D-alanyl-D-alanine carboxypeptidase/D-alanyl-D-alanine-endopeptidase (penicillin-binding protein 4)
MSYVKTSGVYRRRSKRSNVRKRRVVAFAGIVVLATLVAWLWNDGKGGDSGPRVAAATAAKVARVTAPWTASQVGVLDKRLNGAFRSALNGATGWSLAVVDARGKTLFANRAVSAVAPASTQKLIVAATALAAFGANYRFQTVFAADNPIDDGAINGNVWLAGSGDPSLQTADVRNGIALLSRDGLREVTGRIAVDATALRGPGLNPNWTAFDAGQDYAAPTSALSLDGDTIESHVLQDGSELPVWTPMTDVARYVAVQARQMFAQRGIKVASSALIAPAPINSVVLWNHRSAPLTALETHMLVYSDNHYAEQLLRALGSRSMDDPDDAGGIAAERRFLQIANIPTPGFHVLDGSGLSHGNRVAAITLAHLLAAKENELYPLLPRGGRDGTLSDYRFTTALGRVRAKSGHLATVSALAGYATTVHHGRVAFAFLIDGSPGDPDASIVSAVDRLVEL